MDWKNIHEKVHKLYSGQRIPRSGCPLCMEIYNKSKGKTSPAAEDKIQELKKQPESTEKKAVIKPTTPNPEVKPQVPEVKQATVKKSEKQAKDLFVTLSPEMIKVAIEDLGYLDVKDAPKELTQILSRPYILSLLSKLKQRHASFPERMLISIVASVLYLDSVLSERFKK